MNPSHQQSNSSLEVNSVIDTATATDDFVSRKVTELMDQESFRKRTTQIIVDHTDSVPFMKKVQGYADEQIDKRLFKNAKVVLGIFIGWVVTAVIAFVAAKIGE